MLSNGWSWYVIALAVLNILGMVWLLIATGRSDGSDETKTTGHNWDGIEEMNNPLPRWWLGLFIITIVFAFIYLYLYPGLGSYKGSLNWTQMSQFEEAKQKNQEKQAAYFNDLVSLDIPALSKNPKAMATAERLFANNCAACHGSDGHGAKGFPNLSDDDWLYGNTPQIIKQSITNGRAGVMPKLGLTPARVSLMAYYVKHLSGGEATEYAITEGEKQFALCASCHGQEGKGNQAIGAPNLTDNVWLHGGRQRDIENVLANGMQGNMPSFKSLLSEQEIKLLTAYVLTLSRG